jgi:hypothetical protein
MVKIVGGSESLIAFAVVDGKERESIAYKLACINDVFALRSVKVGNINNGAALNVYAGVAFGGVNCHTIEVPGEFRFISEGCGTRRLRFRSLQHSGERKVIKINLPAVPYLLPGVRTEVCWSVLAIGQLFFESE